MRDDVMAEEIEVRASRELAAFRAPEQLPVKAARALESSTANEKWKSVSLLDVMTTSVWLEAHMCHGTPLTTQGRQRP